MDVQREAMTESIEEHELAEMMEAATKLQTMFRGKCARKHLEEKRAAIAAKEKEAERLARMESTASMDQGVPSWDDAKPSLNARPSQRASNVSVMTTAGVIAHDDGEELKVQMALAQLSAAYEQEVKYGEGLGLDADDAGGDPDQAHGTTSVVVAVMALVVLSGMLGRAAFVDHGGDARLGVLTESGSAVLVDAVVLEELVQRGGFLRRPFACCLGLRSCLALRAPLRS